MRWRAISIAGISAKRRIHSQYSLTKRRTASLQQASRSPAMRPARMMLAASRFTSHSQGPRWVSSKSLMSSTISEPGVAKKPKFLTWASPHIWTSIFVCGEWPRSAAMISTDPRKKANGDLLINLNLTGSSRAMCFLEASLRTSRGSNLRLGRSASDDRPKWARWAKPCCFASFWKVIADFLRLSYAEKSSLVWASQSSLAVRLQQLLRVLPRCFRQLCPAQHPCNLFRALIRAQGPHQRLRSSRRFAFLYHIMMIGK